MRSRVEKLGLRCSLVLTHNADGTLTPLTDHERNVFRIWSRHRGLLSRINGTFQRALVEGRQKPWRCRAGARCFYVCEHGLVHYCAAQRGTPGIPLDLYTKDDIRRAYRTAKACSPWCSSNCVHQTSMADYWRAPQTLATFTPQPPSR